MLWVLFMFWQGMEKERMGREDVVEDEDESKYGIPAERARQHRTRCTRTIR